jgi:DNA polymerase-3 subunit epsilon
VSPTRLQAPRANADQRAFDELGQPLREVTFVVVDLETTGGSPHDADGITEIGAVKVRGGDTLGEFATLVDPGRPIPVQITMLTGITDAMVYRAPHVEAVLPSFLEFVRGCVLVAHNAPYDVGFLKAACARHGMGWPKPPVVDTVQLARKALSRDEAPSVRLGALAPLLKATVQPDHRALTDARATVDVLHALLERLGSLGVHSLPELLDAMRDVSPARRRKRHLADALPAAPGVYLFRGRRDEVLYVGTATDLRRRVRSYFSGSEKRSRIKQMLALAERVDHVQCAHPLEANVRELRLIAAHRPPYNRRSREPTKASWITITEEAFPRLSIVSSPKSDRTHLGPFQTRSAAEAAVEALLAVIRLRSCTQRIRRADPRGSPCALYGLGRCGAPCAGLESAPEYADHVSSFERLVAGRPDPALASLFDRLDELAAATRFEDAARHRDRTAALIAGLQRRQRLGGLAAIRELVAAAPDGRGGWWLVVIRHGRLAASGHAPCGVPPMPVVDVLVASAETVHPVPGPLPGASAEEVGTVLRWLDTPGVRLVRLDGEWSSPIAAAARYADPGTRTIGRPAAGAPESVANADPVAIAPGMTARPGARQSSA